MNKRYRVVKYSFWLWAVMDDTKGTYVRKPKFRNTVAGERYSHIGDVCTIFTAKTKRGAQKYADELNGETS